MGKLNDAIAMVERFPGMASSDIAARIGCNLALVTQARNRVNQNRYRAKQKQETAIDVSKEQSDHRQMMEQGNADYMRAFHLAIVNGLRDTPGVLR